MSSSLFELQVLEAIRQNNDRKTVSGLFGGADRHYQVPQLPHPPPLHLQGVLQETRNDWLQSFLMSVQTQRLQALHTEVESCMAAQNGCGKQQQQEKQQTENKNNDNKQKSNNGQSYASRHQAAEQRRRLRINDRLDTLRKLVPHKERSNTASFLTEVIEYVQYLQSKVEDQQVHGGTAGAAGESRKRANESDESAVAYARFDEQSNKRRRIVQD